MSLLEKAKSFKKKHKNKITSDEIDLALAWLRGEIALAQVQYGANLKTTGQAYIFLALTLRAAYENKNLVIKS